MDSDKKIESILQKIYSVDDRSVFISQIDIVQESIYKPELSNQSLDKFANLISDLIQSSSNKVELLNELRDKVGKMRILDLTISFEPRILDVERIVGWVKNNFGSDVIVAYKVDSGIIGGAKIAFNGRFLDETLVNKLTSYWQSQGKSWLKTLGIGL